MNKFNVKIVRLFTLLHLLLLVSCSEEVKLNGKDENTNINISYAVVENDTKSLATQEELTINEALLLFYDKDSNQFVDYALAEPSEIDFNLNLNLGSAILSDQEYKIIILGNFKNYTSLTYSNFIAKNRDKDYNELKKNIKAKVIDNNRLSTPLPYAGVLVDSKGNESLFKCMNRDEQTLQLNYTIQFNKLTIRIDFLNLVPDKLDVKWVKVINYRDEAYIFTDLITGHIIENSTLDNSKGVIEPNNVFENNKLISQYIEGGLYVFPNISQYITQSDKTTSAILVCGYYEGSDTESFYRINVGRKEANQTFRAGTSYKVTLHEVLNSGNASEEEAINNKDLNVYYQVSNDWVDSGSNLVSDEMGNYLSVSTTQKTFKGRADEEFLLFVEFNKNSDFKYEFINAPTFKDQYFSIDKVDNYLKITTKQTNDAEEKTNYIKVTHSVNKDVFKVIELKQRDNRIPPIRIDCIYNGKVNSYTDDFSVTIPHQITVGALDFRVHLINKIASWGTMFLQGESIIINTFTILNPWGYDGDYIKPGIARNGSSRNKVYYLEVSNNDNDKPIIITIIQEPK